MTTVNEIKIDDWMEIMQDDKDPYYDLPIHQTINMPPVLRDTTEPTNDPTDMITPITDNNAFGSILIDGQHQFVQTPAQRCCLEPFDHPRDSATGEERAAFR